VLILRLAERALREIEVVLKDAKFENGHFHHCLELLALGRGLWCLLLSFLGLIRLLCSTILLE